jgi:hypothetical protein
MMINKPYSTQARLKLSHQDEQFSIDFLTYFKMVIFWFKLRHEIPLSRTSFFIG